MLFANMEASSPLQQYNNKNARLAVSHHCNSKDDWWWSWFTSLPLERNNLEKGTATTDYEQQHHQQQPPSHCQHGLRAPTPTAAAAAATIAVATAITAAIVNKMA
jgi:hypothetical protein